MMNKTNSRAVEIIRKEFKKRRDVNSKYSLRSFCKLIDVPIGHTSQIFSGKKFLTPKTGTKISKNLNLSEKETENFLAIIDEEKRLRRKNKAFEQILEGAQTSTIIKLNNDESKILNEWYHLPIRELKLIGKENQTIATELGITVDKVESSLELLKQLNLIGDENDEKFIEVKKDNKLSLTIPIEKDNEILVEELLKDIKERIAAIASRSADSNVYTFDMEFTSLAQDN